MRNLFTKCLEFKRHNGGFQQSRRRQVLNISNRSPAKKMLGFNTSHSAVLAISAVICSIGTVKPQRIICKLNHMKTLSLAGRSNSSVSLFSPIARTISRRGRLACANFPEYIRKVQCLAADGSAGDWFSLIADTSPPAVRRQQIVFGYCACHIAPCCHVFLF